jgi:hypothetical protein
MEGVSFRRVVFVMQLGGGENDTHHAPASYLQMEASACLMQTKYEKKAVPVQLRQATRAVEFFP